MPNQYSMLIQPLVLLSIHSLSVVCGQTLSLLTPNSSSISNLITEWTAMGDSYASGIGAGAVQGPDPDRCFRCSNAYPRIIQSGPGSLQPNPEKLNFVACSGAKFSEIVGKQLDRQNRRGRPGWGSAPEFVTITMGGNDIGILPLVLTCIYSSPVTGKRCDAVIQEAFDEMDKDEFRQGLFQVIFLAKRQGEERHGPDFHIFVTGYAQLFNSQTEQCDEVTFRPAYYLLPAEYLTRDRRRRMNELALTLNIAIRTVVEQFPPSDVTFVDYDALFDGHRLCDRFEPNANDDETWFFEPGTTSDPTDQVNAMFSNWFRVFHPTSRGHQAIRGAVIQEVNQVLLSRGAAQTS